MKGWLLKKATTSIMGISNWQRRYIWLKDDKLYFYDGDEAEDLKKAKKMVEMQKVKVVCWHYDERAPNKSKKLEKADQNDKSRFDIYTPGRIFNMKSEYEDEQNSISWLTNLQKCGAYYNPNYDTRFL